MNWIEKAWDDTWGAVWDEFSENNKQNAQKDQINASTNAANESTRMQIEYMKKAQLAQQLWEQEKLRQQLLANEQSQKYGVQGGMLSQGANLANMIAQLQMAAAQQEQNMPKQIAQSALLRQALPNILAMSGGQPVDLPSTVSSIDYAKLAQSLPGLLQGGIDTMKPIYDQIYGGIPSVANGIDTRTGTRDTSGNPVSTYDFGIDKNATSGNRVVPAQYKPGSEPIANGPVSGAAGSTPAAGAGSITPASFSIPNTTTQIPYSNKPVDVRALVMQDPEYALQNSAMNENLNRKLSSMGKTNSSDAAYMGGRLGQQLMSDAFNKAYNKQLNLFNMSMGQSPIQQSTNAASTALGGLSGLGGSEIAKAYQSAADARSKIYGGQKDSSEATMLAQLGNITGAQGKFNAQQGNILAGIENNAPSWLDLAGKAANIYAGFSGFSNPFGTQNSSDLNWFNGLDKTPTLYGSY